MINLNNGITNVKNTPSITADLSSLVPDPTTVPVGALYITTNTDEFLRNDGTNWNTLNKGGSGSTPDIQAVLNVGNTVTDNDIYFIQAGTGNELRIGGYNSLYQKLYITDNVNNQNVVRENNIKMDNLATGAYIEATQDYFGNPRLSLLRDSNFNIITDSFINLSNTAYIINIQPEGILTQDITGVYFTTIHIDRYEITQNGTFAGISYANIGSNSFYSYFNDYTQPNGFLFQPDTNNYNIGNFSIATYLNLDIDNSKFQTIWNSNENGLRVSSGGNIVELGDFANLLSGTYLSIKSNLGDIRSTTNSRDQGIFIRDKQYILGDFAGTNNNTYFEINDIDKTLNFNGDIFKISSNLTTNSAGSNSTLHIKVIISGTEYRIPLKNA